MSAPEPKPSIGALLADLADQTGTLVRQEIALAKIEIDAHLDDAKRGLVGLAVGAFVAYAGLIILLFAAVFGLTHVIPPWAAALAVGVGVLLVSVALVIRGARELARGVDVVPHRAVDEARATVELFEAAAAGDVTAAPSRPTPPAETRRTASADPAAERPTDAGGRGRAAESPGEIPKRGWRDVLLRVKDEMDKDNISLAAAGVAFYALLALFPAIAALVSIVALTLDPSTINAQLDALRLLIPADAYSIIEGQVVEVTESSDAALSAGFLFGIVLSLWSANKGMKALVTGLNIAYDERERRGFVRLNLTTLALTAGAVLVVVAALAAVVAAPIVLDVIGLGAASDTVVLVGRWPAIAVIVVGGLAALYRFGPSRDAPQWQWVSWGSVGATVVWGVASAGFSFYVGNFGSYNETYGSMGAVIVLLMWFYISAYIALIGAELNAELEHQTRRDSTVGPDEPMGERGAYVADTVGEVPE